DADRRVVPEILANEQAHTSKAGVERPDTVSLGEVALVGEHAVRRQVDLAMDVLYGPVLDEGRRDEVVEVARLLHEADHRRRPAGSLAQLAELGGIQPQA